MSTEEIKKPLHHIWPDASPDAESCVKCSARPKYFIIDAGFNWLGCNCTQSIPSRGTLDESYDNWKEINTLQ